jgi:L-rhamnose mutarotase
MQRVAFKMKLFPGRADEYKKRHDDIWAELKDLLKQTGISGYSIFLDEATVIYLVALWLKIRQSLASYQKRE